MPRIIDSIQVDATPEATWAALADFGGVYKYSPGVRHSRTTSPEPTGVGATRHCDLLPMGSVEERILSWDEGVGYSLEIYDGERTPPFRHAHATFRVEPRGSGSAVHAEVDYALRFGPLGWLMDRVMVGRFLRRGFRGLLKGLKNYVEAEGTTHPGQAA